MPRRSLVLILAIAVFSLLCYRRSDRSPYGRHFTEVLEKIDYSYVEPVDKQKLFEGALEGMVGRLDDHSAFITRRETAQFQEALDQEFGGVGIEVAVDPKTQALMVMSPLVGTPAYLAGVRAGDRIVAIDGQSTEGFALKDAVGSLRGKPAEPVVLSVVHEGETEPVDYPLTREIIVVSSVLGDVRESDGSWNYFLPGYPDVGYLRITTFGAQTDKELHAAMRWLAQHNCRGLLIDLRNNPGGLLQAAVGASDMFLDKGQMIVNTRGRDGEVREEWRASGAGAFSKLPLVILVNHYSASASEIMAAALQDHERATIVGQRSWGKGTVQNVIPVEGGRSVLKLTTASYWRPSGKNIHRLKTSEETDEWGVKPDLGYDIPMIDKDLSAWLEYRRHRDVVLPPDKTPPSPEVNLAIDPQLAKAIECLEAKLGRTTAPAKATAAAR